jgi:hypothetical protein
MNSAKSTVLVENPQEQLIARKEPDSSFLRSLLLSPDHGKP